MHTIRSTGFWGVVFMLGFSINSVLAKPSTNYPPLYENHTSSENVEITKLIDGPIDSLYRINRTDEYLAQTNSRLWKINAKGQIIDYFDPDHFYASGLILEKEGFSDWVFTGDKHIKPYGKTLDAKDYSDQQLFEAFDQADAIEFVDKDETGYAYIYQQGQVSILDISNRRDQIDDFYYRQSLSKNHNLRREETDIKASRFENHERKNPAVEFLTEIDQESAPFLKVTGFKKIANHYPVSMAETFFENTLGRLFTGGSRRDYSYPVGYTQYQLLHQNELLNFSIFSGESYDPQSSWNFSLLNAPSNNTGDLIFITVNYRRHYLSELNEKSLLPYYEQDVGLYVVRKKIPHNQNKNTQWQLSYSGLHAYDSIWGNIQFAQQELEPVFYWFRQDRPIPAAAKADMDHFGRRTNIASPVLKALPASLDFHWSDFKRDRNFRLVINHQDAEFYKPEDTRIAIKLYFDTDELTRAFAQFKDATHSIQMELDLQERDFGGELVISLKDDDKKIILKNTSFDYQEIPYAPKSPQIKPGKIQTELFLAYEESLFQYNPDKFLAKVNQLKQLNAIADYAVPLGYYFANLSLMLNAKGRFPENNKLFTQYFLLHQDITRNQVDELQQKNLMVLAAQGIYLGSNSMNPDLNKKVIATFVEQNFDLEQETNRVFLFNIACHYAVNHNKPQMLKIINRAIALGKNPDDFLKDNDFKDYWQDPDFLKAIKKDPAQ
jgi:hypothetical protein